MPAPIGPRQISTNTSPRLIAPDLIAAIAAGSVRNTFAGPVKR